jgi:hypothetical protein
MQRPRLISIQQPEFFPWLGYFDKIRQVDCVVFLDNVQFKKRYFENRNKVRTYQGWTYITAPVLSKGRYTQKINETEIDNSRPWQRDLVNTIQCNYRKTPYWRDLGDELCALVVKPCSRLVDFNLSVIFLMMRKLGLEREWKLASSLGTAHGGSDLILEICVKMETERYLSGRDGRNYLDEKPFAEAGIQVLYQDFQHPGYSQLHGAFESALSVIDLYFNHGPASLSMIEQAQVGYAPKNKQGEQYAIG